MILSRRVIQVKSESTQGIDAVPVTGTDDVRVENPVPSWVDGRSNERASTKPSLSAETARFGGALGQLTFDVQLKGSGVAGTAPEFAPLLKACYHDETIVASTSVTYAPISTAAESCTIYFNDDGKRYILLGCFGDMTFSADAGQAGRLSFTMTGHMALPTDVALPSPTFEAAVAPVYLGASFLSDSFAAKISNLGFALGNVISKPSDVSATDGYGDLQVTARSLTGSFDPLDAVIATYAWESKWQNDTLVAIDSGLVGATAGNQWRIQFPTAQYREIGHADRDSIKSLEVGFTAVENTGDDEYSLAFT
jgi:hypothetical protein